MVNDAVFKQQLKALISEPSVSSDNPRLDQSNIAVVSMLANWLEPLGFACEIQAIEGHPGKANLIAVKGQGSGGLVLAGHSDTVPFDADQWVQDPFELREQGNRLYGLGATDMKGFFPVVLAACEALKDMPLTAPLIVLATADEESSMCGARALTRASLHEPRFAVIGEPTGLKPIRMHKGILLESIEIFGQSGHSSNPALGKSALEAMHDVITHILKLRQALQEQYNHPGFHIPTPTVNLGCIHGGDNPNRICGRCELHYDVRLIPGMPIGEIRQRFEQVLRPIAEAHQTDITFTPLFPGIAAYEEDEQSELVKVVERLTGHPSESVLFATEAPFLKAMGAQTLVMGPGNIDQAHQPNEFIDMSQIAPAVSIVKDLIQSCCGIQKTH